MKALFNAAALGCLSCFLALGCCHRGGCCGGGCAGGSCAMPGASAPDFASAEQDDAEYDEVATPRPAAVHAKKVRQAAACEDASCPY